MWGTCIGSIYTVLFDLCIHVCSERFQSALPLAVSSCILVEEAVEDLGPVGSCVTASEKDYLRTTGQQLQEPLVVY